MSKRSIDSETEPSKTVKLDKKSAAASCAALVAPADVDVTTFFPQSIQERVAALLHGLKSDRHRELARAFKDAEGLAELSFSFKTGRLCLTASLGAKEDRNDIDAIVKYLTNEDGFGNAMDNLVDLVAKGRLHAQYAMGANAMSLGLHRCHLSVLFLFAAERHPELLVSGVEDDPLTADDYKLEDLVRVVRRVLAKSHKHHVLTARAPLPDVLAKAIV